VKLNKPMLESIKESAVIEVFEIEAEFETL
jgi:hypothetical protein